MPRSRVRSLPAPPSSSMQIASCVYLQKPPALLAALGGFFVPSRRGPPASSTTSPAAAFLLLELFLPLRTVNLVLNAKFALPTTLAAVLVLSACSPNQGPDSPPDPGTSSSAVSLVPSTSPSDESSPARPLESARGNLGLYTLETPEIDPNLESAARAIAVAADRLAASNSGVEANLVSGSNIDQAASESGLSPADGWTVDTGYGPGVRLSLASGGKTSTVCVEPVQQSTGEYAWYTRAALRSC